jgi:hypothetical protein
MDPLSCFGVVKLFDQKYYHCAQVLGARNVNEMLAEVTLVAQSKWSSPQAQVVLQVKPHRLSNAPCSPGEERHLPLLARRSVSWRRSLARLILPCLPLLSIEPNTEAQV